MVVRPVCIVLIAAAAVAACSSRSDTPAEATSSTSQALAMGMAPVASMPLPIFPVPHPGEHHPVPTANNLLLYYGGRVLSSVKIIQVFWGPNVDPTVTGGIGGFYNAVAASTYLDWLEEYDTIGLNGQDGQPGSNQHIGKTSYMGNFTIAPVNGNTTLSEIDIGNELAAQIAAGHLPQPTVDAGGNINSIYMIDFPVNIAFTLMGTAQSCTGFCAYHFSTTIGGKQVPYGVHPDINSCGGGCGSGLSEVTVIHSHELAEAMTDTEVGAVNFMAGNVGRPAAWYYQTGGEIGDICVGMGNTMVGAYTAQLLWSNFAGACVGGIPLCTGPNNPAGCRPCTMYDDNAGCTAPQPVCEINPGNAKAGQCVQCIANPQCSGGAPICDTTGDTCRACTAADCTGATPVCITAGANAGKCVQCNAMNKAACTGMTPVCNTATNKCVGCLTDMNCASKSAPICDTGTQTCRPCKATDCKGATPVCETSGALVGQCVQCDPSSMAACTGATPTCDATSHTCRGCQANADCQAPQGVCDVSGGTCVECVAGTDCASGTCDMQAHTCIAPGGNGAGGGTGGSGGCGCKVAGHGGSAPMRSAGLLLLGAVALACRRRGRRVSASRADSA